jgi:hypothetical protein
MKLLIMQFSPTSGHFISLWSKYSPQYPVLKHTQSAAAAAAATTTTTTTTAIIIIIIIII